MIHIRDKMKHIESAFEVILSKQQILKMHEIMRSRLPFVNGHQRTT